MSAALTFASNQTFANSTYTKLNFTTPVQVIGPAALVTAASAQFNILRPSNYQLVLQASTHSGNSTACNCELFIYNGASQIALALTYSAGTVRILLSANTNLSLAAGATLTPYGYYDAGSFTTSYLEVGTPPCNQFSIQEIPTW